MSSSPGGPPVPEGPGSVSGAPDLPAGFTDTFASRYITLRDDVPRMDQAIKHWRQTQA